MLGGVGAGVGNGPGYPISVFGGGGIHPCRIHVDQTQRTTSRDIVQAFPGGCGWTPVEFDRMNKIDRIKKESCQSCDPVQDPLCGRFNDGCQ